MKLHLLLVATCFPLVAQAQESDAPKKYPSPDGSAYVLLDKSGKRDDATLVAGSTRKRVFTGDDVDKMFRSKAAEVLKVKPAEISKVTWPDIGDVKWISPQEAQVTGTVTISFVDTERNDYPELSYKVSVTKAGAVKLVSLTNKAGD